MGEAVVITDAIPAACSIAIIHLLPGTEIGGCSKIQNRAERPSGRGDKPNCYVMGHRKNTVNRESTALRSHESRHKVRDGWRAEPTMAKLGQREE